MLCMIKISFQCPQCLKGFAAYGIIFMLQFAFWHWRYWKWLCLWRDVSRFLSFFQEIGTWKRKARLYVLSSSRRPYRGEAAYPFALGAASPCSIIRLPTVSKLRGGLLLLDWYCVFYSIDQVFFCVDIDSSSHAADFGTVGRTPHFGSQFFTSYFWLTKLQHLC